MALRSRGPTLPLLRPRQLLKPAGQFFDLPAHVTRVLRSLRPPGLLQVMGNDPVTVAVWGEQLEEPYRKRDFLHLDQDARGQPGGRPLPLLPMTVAFFLTQTPPPGALQGSEEGPLPAVNDLEIFRRRVPPGKPERARAELLLVQGVDKQLLARLVRGLPISVRGLPPGVKRIKFLVLAPPGHQPHYPHPFDHPRLVATGLGTDAGNEPRVAFILDALLHTQTGVFAVLNPVFA
jgi:hypothetical protein